MTLIEKFEKVLIDELRYAVPGGRWESRKDKLCLYLTVWAADQRVSLRRAFPFRQIETFESDTQLIRYAWFEVRDINRRLSKTPWQPRHAYYTIQSCLHQSYPSATMPMSGAANAYPSAGSQ